MQHKSKQNNKYKKLSSILPMIGLAGIIVWVGISSAKEFYNKYGVSKKITNLKEEIRAISEENSSLSSIIESFENPNVIEKEAKRRLNLKRPGEEVVVILRNNQEGIPNIIIPWE